MLRKSIKILAAVIGILLLFLLWALQSVDYTPYFESEYYKFTKSRLDSLSRHRISSYGKLSVGFGRSELTPDFSNGVEDVSIGKFSEIPLSGYGARRGAPATGVHDSLFVKAVALKVQDQTVVLIGADLLIMPPEVSAKVDSTLAEKLDMARANIFYSATHTHSSVGAWSGGTIGELFNGTYDPKVVDWLSRQVASAIEMAIKDLKPGKIGTTNFDASGFIRNRLVGDDGQINGDFIVLEAHQIHGKKALLGSFGAHATTLGDWNMETSADYPGYWQRKLEQKGYDMAVFYAGSVGSHSYISKGERFEKPTYIGEALADSVLKYTQNLELKDSIDLSAMTLKVDLPEFHIRISDGLRLNPMIANWLFPDVGDVYLQALKLDNLIWATSPSDFSGETAIIYKNSMHKKGYRALVSSFNGGYTGYILPCKYYHYNAYESRLMNWFGPGYNPMINYLIGEMMEEVSED